MLQRERSAARVRDSPRRRNNAEREMPGVPAKRLSHKRSAGLLVHRKKLCRASMQPPGDAAQDCSRSTQPESDLRDKGTQSAQPEEAGSDDCATGAPCAFDRAIRITELRHREGL